jgi:uncharacterized protein (TIGR02231 family)
MVMKPPKTLLLIGVLLNALVNAYAQDEQILNSAIESVIVYPDSARVTRMAEADVGTGVNQLVFQYLPNNIDANSIKAEIIGATGSVLVRDVTVKYRDAEFEDYPELKKLEEKADSLQAEIAKIENEINLVNGRHNFAKQIATSFTDGYGKREGSIPGAEEIEATWSFYERTAIDSQQQMDVLKDQIKPIREAFDETEKEIDILKTALKGRRMTIEVLVESGVAEKVMMKLHYQVYGCSWFPVYELRAYPLKTNVQFRYQASIAQNSGEDWQGVNLTLSSSRANTWGDVPQLNPIRLNQVEPMLLMEKPRAAMKMEQAMDSFTQPSSAMGRSVMAQPSFNSSFSAFEVRLPQKITIESGNDRKKALIKELEMKGDFWTEIVPTRSEEGFLVAEVTNDFELPIMQGDAILFVDDQMVGKSSLKETAIGEKLELSLGINEKISVERKTGKQNEADRGIIGKKTRLTRQYFTIVKNHSGNEQRIKVKDQFPISENEKIEVKGILPKPDDAEFEADTGIFTLDFMLKASEDKQLETRFEVIYPQDWTIPTNF